MFLRFVLVVKVSVLPVLISGSQIPIFNKVVGDVPHPNDYNVRTPACNTS